MKKRKIFKKMTYLTLLSTMLIGSTNILSLYATNQMNNSFNVDSLTLQPGETTSSINLNWYVPDNTTKSIIKFGNQEINVTPQSLTTPTKVDNNKYKDSDKLVCKTTISNLKPATEYQYQISNDGQTWSKIYTYTTPASNEFKFGFISDPQIKESGETNSSGWNPSDNTNQTGWSKMMEVLVQNDIDLVVSAGDQVEDQSWGKTSEYDAFFAPEEMTSIPFAPAIGNHDRHYMFKDHFNLPNQMTSLEEVKTTFRGQNSGTSQSHGNYILATDEEIINNSESNGVTPNQDGYYDFEERRTMETEGNYYYLYNNVLFVTLNTGAYPGGNDQESDTISGQNDNKEAEAIVDNFEKTLSSAINKYQNQYNWIIVTHHKSTQTVAKHAADSDIENYVDAGFEKLMDKYDVDFVLGGHDHVYSRSYVLKDGQRNAEKLDTINDPDGTIYLTANCCSDMQYYGVHEKLDKTNNSDYPLLANGKKGSQAYLEGEALPIGNQEWNQEYSPSYALFNVTDKAITVNVYNLDGDSNEPSSKKIDSFTVTKNADTATKISGFDNKDSTLAIEQSARYVSGISNSDGGVMEIIDYNTKTGWAYAVNGQTGNLTAIAIKDLENKETIDLLDGNDIDIKSLVEKEDPSFEYGDMTSVAIASDGKSLALALQANKYDNNGRVAIFNCHDDGTLSLLKITEVGIQPDNIVYSSDNTQILTANEGEPREGYDNNAVDPKGSISIINTLDYNTNTIYFDSFDSKRDKLTEQGIIIKKGSNPSTDFEPEYISTSDTKAYVTLQEANAIAVLDLVTQTITDIYSAGYEDYSKIAVDIDKKDETYNPKTYPSLKGIRMPDSISVKTIDGVDYIITANEGDSRDWNGYSNEIEVNFGKNEISPSGKITAETSNLKGKVVFFDQNDYDGLNIGNDYLFGGRTMTIYRLENNQLEEVYSTGSDFEKITAKYLPNNFNCSNDDKTIDDRSGKKGPEAESVTVGTINNNTYAFVGLERIGGIMIYDITDPANSKYVNYINSRDFSSDNAGDNSPEGLKFIKDNNDNAKLIAAYEVSGTIGVYDLTYIEKNVSQQPDNIEKPSDNNSNQNITTSPQTGDLSNFKSYSLLGAISLITIMTYVRLKKYSV